VNASVTPQADPDDRPPKPPWLQVVDTVLHAYAQVLFSKSRPIGAALLTASFVVPDVGYVGLLGVLITSAMGWVLQFDRDAIKDGLLGYNGLLVFLGIGALFEHSAAFWALAVPTALLVVVIHVALQNTMQQFFRLPVLSLPFVAVLWIITLASPHIRGMRFVNHIPALDLGAFPGPDLLDGFLRAMGAIFFQPHWTAGLLVFGSLIAWSRIATVYAVVGYAVAVLADAYLLSFPPEVFHIYVGFNVVLTAVALGGIFYIPSTASLLLGTLGSMVAALLSVAMVSGLQPLGLPVLAAPLNLTVLVTLYALGLRTVDASPRSPFSLWKNGEYCRASSPLG